MPTATDPQPQIPQQPPRPQQPATDPLVTLCLVIVGALVLGMAGYVCVAPSLTGPIATVAGALAAAFGVVIAVRRR
ncbi:hypothetical protein OG444_40650 (plasmid) [Streptomyces sp. NBC_01232]|uniref:hypothetical protein n=1 Tax=Streptomyces sp. NBC_01232 TaxID=2903786 RepID=UPI002E124075|nr:hypothetical protein OG444_40650 [Streptomyces sp. NBC_01232]